MKAIIYAIMGCSCSGKSTLISAVNEIVGAHTQPKIGVVEVGKMLRAKYPPSHFQGQAAPAHTQTEAWTMCEEAIKALLDAGAQVIFVDGQPRSLDQVQLMLNLSPQYPVQVRFVSLYAPAATRAVRGAHRDNGDEAKMLLTAQRFHNDPISQYEVVMDLLSRGQTVGVVDTTIQSSYQTVELLISEANNALLSADLLEDLLDDPENPGK